MKEKIISVKEKKLAVVPNLKDYEKVYNTFKWQNAEKELSFFPEKKLNAAYNAVDRHVKAKGEKIALYWENENGAKIKYTFKELSALSNKFANILKKLKIKKGDRCYIFLPRIPELYISFLGILKIGAIATILFPAFGTKGVEERVEKAKPLVIITNTELYERVKNIKNKPEYFILADSDNTDRKKISFKKEMEKAPDEFEIVKLDKNDEMILMFTSSTGGTPVEGIVLTQYSIVQQYATTKFVLDLHEKDIYWCTADPGWITGVVYGILGPWICGNSIISYEGRFDADKWIEILKKYKVNVFYTAPTALRMLRNSKIEKISSRLRHICCVGEALNPETIEWTREKFGLVVHDTYWQTETGAMMICNFPSVPVKEGSMGKPVPGVKAAIVDKNGKKVMNYKEGDLAFKPGWPGMMKTVWGNKKMYKSYFHHKYYITNDHAYKDKDGYFWFVGRASEIIKTSGERVSPFEIESILLEHPFIAEAAVIGKPDPLRGEIIKAFIVLKNKKPSEQIKENIQQFVKKEFAGHAYPREIEFIDKLPKTRSGKILRRLLKAKEMKMKIKDMSMLEE